jgi:GT2 family glycosyltransferase
VSASGSAGVDVEILVIDDGSSDGSSEAAARFAASSLTEVRVLRQPPSGLSRARNTSLRQARGAVLAFIDDDCIASPDYIDELMAHFAMDQEPVLRGGRVELGDPADAPLAIITSPHRAHLKRGQHPSGFILGCNMAMSREVVAKVGPFDERLGAGAPLKAAEDTDFILRAVLAGVPVEYVPDMTVHHHHGRRVREAVYRTQRNYSIGDGALAMKHTQSAPWLWKRPYWTVRNAIAELSGGPRFDQRIGLSHARVAVHLLLGAAMFAWRRALPRRGAASTAEQDAALQIVQHPRPETRSARSLAPIT